MELEPVGPSRETIESLLRAARAQRPVLHDLALDLLRQLAALDDADAYPA